MKVNWNFNQKKLAEADVIVVSGFSKKEKSGKKKEEKSVLDNNHWPKEIKEQYNSLKGTSEFTGAKGSSINFNLLDGTLIFVWGMGEKSKLDNEDIRKQAAKIYKALSKSHTDASIMLDHFVKGNFEQSLNAFVEGFEMAAYTFDKHLSNPSEASLESITFVSKESKAKENKAKKVYKATKDVTDSIAFGRDLVNEPPNVLNSVSYAKIVEKDAKSLKRVKVKVLNKAMMKKEKMDLFLSVNAGSAYDARLVHLTYTPAKVTSKTKHIALVGKGLTFDTGGYSLKPSSYIMNMKYDMAGSATVYAAFRACALLGVNAKVSCFLGMTDNAVSSTATMPDSIVKARNGKTVEILNTDAEGRLVLADCLDYACDQKPDQIIDAATLTGACLAAVGHEMCAVMGNDKKLVKSLLDSADKKDEYMWQLPIIDEYREDMKGRISDLKNMAGKPYAGTAKAAAFLEEFIKDDISWAHLDIAGIGDSQGGHKPYCPAKGASGLVVRTLVHHIENA